MATAPSSIRTFSDATAFLAAHGKTVEPVGNKLWAYDGMLQFDKGGIIVKAKELAAKLALAPDTTPVPDISTPWPYETHCGHKLQTRDGRWWFIVAGWGKGACKPVHAVAAEGPWYAHLRPEDVLVHRTGRPDSKEYNDAVNAWVDAGKPNWELDGCYGEGPTKGQPAPNPLVASAPAVPLPPRGNPIGPDHVFKSPLIMKLDRGPQMIALEEIVPGRWQPRTVFDDGSLQELAASIKEHGLLNPIKVFFNEAQHYELIAGERRWKAHFILGMDMIAADVVEWSARQIHEAAILDNLQREGLTPIEEGAAYERLIKELGISENELSKRLSKPRTYIQVRRALAASAPEIHQAIAAGTLTITHARAIAAGAPGDHVSQATATKEVLELVTAGHRCTEETAQRKAERAVLANHKKALRKLGWKIEEPGSYSDERPLIWSKADRPSYWTGGEILEAVRQGRRAGETPVTPAQLTPAIRTLLARRSYQVSETFAPWLKFSQKPPRFMDGDELTRFAAEIEEECNALEVRYKIAGWTLTFQQGETAYWGAKSHAHRIEQGYTFDQALRFIARIESGEVKAEPEPIAKSAQPESKRTCEGCKKEFAYSALEYWASGYRCKSCIKDARAKIEGERAAIREQLMITACIWIDTTPDDVLRLLLMNAQRVEGLPQVYQEQARAKAILESTREQLLEMLTNSLVDMAYTHPKLRTEQPKAKEASA